MTPLILSAVFFLAVLALIWLRRRTPRVTSTLARTVIGLRRARWRLDVMQFKHDVRRESLRLRREFREEMRARTNQSHREIDELNHDDRNIQ